MKRCFALLLVLTLIGSLAACKQENTPVPDTVPATDPVLTPKTVDLCLPGETGTWSAYADPLTAQLEAQGHAVRVRYAQNDSAQQAQQVKTAVTELSDCVVLVPVDAMAITDAMAEAVNAGVKVLTLERQLYQSAGFHGAVSFDYAHIGKTIAGHIVQARQLETAKAEKRSYTIEFFMGSTDDYSAQLLHRGILEVLQPYLDDGVLDCKTGRISFEDTYIQHWDTDRAKEKCLRYLEEYKKDPVDILCAASDAIARGCIAALTEKGYTAEHWPVITGCGGETTALQAISDGKQTSTVYTDKAALVNKCGELVHLLLTGAALPAPNGALGGSTREAPLYFCPATPVYGKDAAQALLTPASNEGENSST